MKKKNSILIRPLLILFDLIIINVITFVIVDKEYSNLLFLSYINILWLFISFYTGFYNVYRYTHVIKLITLLVSQFFVFSLAYLSYFSIFREGVVVHKQSLVFLLIFGTITFFKFFFFYLLKKYRTEGKNFRNIVLFGDKFTADKIEKLINNKNDLGYRFFGFFSDTPQEGKHYLGDIKSAFEYILKNKIDEVYCEISIINQIQIKQIRKFISEHKLDLRIIPENKAIYSKDFILEYYGTLPILKPKPLPFEQIETIIIKRLFDIIFSLFVCFFLLSWFLPLMWIIIRIDSKGPFFFKQKRDGIDGKQFYCYKLRSMQVNSEADKISATKNDKRITKVGAFLRKTSLDELPQFINVLLGDMSVVGPRPHINVQTKKYSNEVDNYLIRNSIKPGITGLAQVSGYRGEVKIKADIENRVRLDIFYIENWSFFLDLKIIGQTVFSVFKKDEKAY